MRRAIVALLTTLAVVFAATTPAYAVDDDKQWFYANTYKNAPASGFYTNPNPAVCQSLAGSTLDNASKSLHNWKDYRVAYYNTYNCSGGYFRVNANSGLNTLPAGWPMTISSWRVCEVATC